MNAARYNASEDMEIDLGTLFGSLWRRKGFILLIAFMALVPAVMFLFLKDPVYKSEAKLLIGPRETVFTRPEQENNNQRQETIDNETVASQIEVVRSRDLAKQVISELNLADRAEFDPARKGPSVTSMVLGMIGLGGGSLDVSPEERVLSSYFEKLDAFVVPSSRVVGVEFTSENPRLATEVLDKVTTKYLTLLRSSELSSTQDASNYLRDEIQRLRVDLLEAEKKVEAFRSGADLFAGRGEDSLLSQQLSETLTQVSNVKGERAEAVARARQIRRLIESGGSLDTVTEVQDSPLIQNLRQQQVALRTRITDLSTNLLPNHPQLKAAKSQIEDLNREINRQALNIAKALEGDAKVLQARAEEIEREVARLKASASEANAQGIQLRDLERNAAAQRELLESYERRYREASSRQNAQTLPVNAAIISAASVPTEVAFPKPVPTLGIAVVLGLLLGSVIVMLSELFSGRAMVAKAEDIYASAEDPTELDAAVAESRSKNVSRGKREPNLNISMLDGLDDLEDEQDDFASHRLRKSGANLREEFSDIELSEEADVAYDEHEEADADLVEQLAEERKVASARKAEPVEYSALAELKAVRDRLASEAIEADNVTVLSEHRNEKSLQMIEDAFGAIEQFDLRFIVVSPLSTRVSAADAALHLARTLSEEQKAVLFIDISEKIGIDEDAPILAGLSDLVAGKSEYTDVIFQDPTSRLHMMLSGLEPLTTSMWDSGKMTDVLETLALEYTSIVLHASEGITMEQFPHFVDEADVILFAGTSSMTRHNAMKFVAKRLGTLPPHSMFIEGDEHGLFKSAAQ